MIRITNHLRTRPRTLTRQQQVSQRWKEKGQNRISVRHSASGTDRLVLRKPDDFHLHVRDGEMLKAVVPYAAKVFGRCIIMPNTVPPITNVEMAVDYKKKIASAAATYTSFKPLMALYLTDSTTEETVYSAKASEDVAAFKLYPAGATTNSENGVTDVWKLLPVFKAMSRTGIPLLVHGEVVDDDIDVFDRERVFIQRILEPLLDQIPALRVVMEHITTLDAVDFVKKTPDNVAATITPQHIIMNRNALFKVLANSQVRLPPSIVLDRVVCVLIIIAYLSSREKNIVEHFFASEAVNKTFVIGRSVLHAATSGNPKFFLGTDSAPHHKNMKESSCGCAGIFSSPVAMSVYAEAFEEVGALDKLESFSSEHGARFYGIEPNEEKIRLDNHQWTVPEDYVFDDIHLTPLKAGETLRWRVHS